MSARTHDPVLAHHINEGGPWALIESDPAIFTALLNGLGITGAQFIDVYWPLDDQEQWTNVGNKVYGFIFLFAVDDAEIDKSGEEFDDDEELARVYFANQVIDNACATLAILNIVLNSNELEIGQELENFKNFTADFKPPLKGLAITNYPKFRKNHNMFVRFPEELHLEKPNKSRKSNKSKTKKCEEKEPVYHYTCYIPVEGNVYEIDGLARNPRKIGPIGEQNWFDVARDAINEKITRFMADSIQFSLLALVKEQVLFLREKLCETVLLKKFIEERVEKIDPYWREHYEIPMEVEIGISDEEKAAALRQPHIAQTISSMQQLDDIIELLQRHKQITQEIEPLHTKLETERHKSEEQKVDNMRRKFDYIPFIKKYVEILHERGELGELLEMYSTE